ncbi:MAG: DNA polymerase III subunit alpha, partial [Gammaproteobacteria bacterium]|nr:DNA polymerase III subunit alpha [Gammaproteobacteria bacterium]
MPGQEFVHLHLHTEYSIADGLSRVPELVARTRALGMPAVAVTDRSNTFALLKFFRAAREAGIKPVLGCEVFVAPDDGDAAYPLVLLCSSYEGYQSMAGMLSRAYLEDNRRGTPRINAAWMSRDALSGLIALSGGIRGDVGQALCDGNEDVARRRLETWQSLMDDRYYVEISRTGRPDEASYVDAAVTLADTVSAPLVATNDVRFIDSNDFEAHEARVCVQEGALLSDPRRPRRYSNQQYLRSPEEMWALFADLPDALENTVGIAQRCNVGFDLDTYHMPQFPDVAPGEVDELLSSEASAGLNERLGAAAGEQVADAGGYKQRLEHELGVITKMGFAGYFLIVADFVRWAKQQGIPVGPGRGSGAGSLVAYALGITELDPLEYELLFERFLNPERVSMPDFDIDFCMERRDEVIDYVVERYGRDRVAQIITHGTMAAKAVVRDIGRVLGFSYGFVDEIAKQIPFEIGMTLTRALEESPELKARYAADEEVQSIIDLALKLEGLARNAGRHAGGVVISPQPLRDYMPLYCEQGTDAPVTQFDMGDVEAVGLVKFDFLGLRT